MALSDVFAALVIRSPQAIEFAGEPIPVPQSPSPNPEAHGYTPQAGYGPVPTPNGPGDANAQNGPNGPAPHPPNAHNPNAHNPNAHNPNPNNPNQPNPAPQQPPLPNQRNPNQRNPRQGHPAPGQPGRAPHGHGNAGGYGQAGYGQAEPDHAARGGMPDAQQAEAALTETIQRVLYDRAYARPFGRATASQQGASPDTASTERHQAFARALQTATPTEARWDPGWKVYQVGQNGQLFVQKGDRHQNPMPGQYATDTPGYGAQVGNAVRLHVPAGSFQLQEGFYFAFGAHVPDLFAEADMARFYLNSSADSAPDVLTRVGGALNDAQVPFRMKTLTHPDAYARVDSTVLYVARSMAPVVADVLASLDRLRTDLGSEVPLFTRTLQPGVGFADDPGTGDSFGMHRCRLAAEAVVRAWRAGRHHPEDRLQSLQARFTEAGLNPDRPHLNPGAADLSLRPASVPLSV